MLKECILRQESDKLSQNVPVSQGHKEDVRLRSVPASCMAATASPYIRGGSTKQIFDAGAFALKSLLGLVCDPLGGLVEVPCIREISLDLSMRSWPPDMAMAGVKARFRWMK